MSSKSNTPAKQRDASLDRLSKLGSMMESPSAPGQEQAAKAIKKKAKEESKPTPKPKREKVKPKAKAQNMGLSLHPADQDRIYKIEEAVRKAGIRGRPSTSLLIKLAIAAFDPSKVDNLRALFEELESQDGRRRK